jgi:O-antigen/teichoic acid export membrane protein
MIASTIAQLGLIINGNMDALLIRRRIAEGVPECNSGVLPVVFTFRALASLTIIAIAISFALLPNVSRSWSLAIILAAPAMLGSSLNATWLLQSRDNPGGLYKIGLAQACIGGLLAAIFVRPGMHAGVDLLVQGVSQVLVYLAVWIGATNNSPIQLVKSNCGKDVLNLFRDAKWLTLTGLVLYVYVSADIAIIGYILSVPDAGRYRAAITITAVVQAFLAVVPIIIYPKLLKWKSKGLHYLWRMQLQSCRMLLLPLVLVAGIAMYFSSDAINIVYQNRFEGIELPTKLLILSKCIVVLNGIFAWGLWALQRDSDALVIMTVIAVASGLANIVLIPRFGITAAAVVNCASEAAVLVLCLLRSYVLKNREEFHA